MVAVHGSSKMVVALRYRKYFEIVPSSSHALYNMGKISYNWISTNPGLEEKTENERFTVVSSRSRSYRADYGKKIAKMRSAHAARLFFFITSIVWWRCRCRIRIRIRSRS